MRINASHVSLITFLLTLAACAGDGHDVIAQPVGDFSFDCGCSPIGYSLESEETCSVESTVRTPEMGSCRKRDSLT